MAIGYGLRGTGPVLAGKLGEGDAFALLAELFAIAEEPPLTPLRF